MRNRWLLHPPCDSAQALAREIGASPLAAQCLINRGYADPGAARLFLNPRLKDLGDPFELPDMGRAVERLMQAREAGETCVIFGDYDVDGVTSTAILQEGLQLLGWRVSHYLPHRLDEGYGLSLAAVETCFERFTPTLFIAADCGSTTPEPIEWLQRRGVDVVVLDHHQLSDPEPPAFALVNPQRAGAGKVGRELCAAGLAFKLLHAVVKRGRDRELDGFAAFDVKCYLELVALGTVADMSPLVGENRAMVAAGLRRLDTSARPGLEALKEVARTRSPVGVYEAGFQLAPRLNAAGRLETAEAALDLLLSPDIESARSIAEALDSANRERQTIERRIAEEAVAQARARFRPEEDLVVVEGRAEWHLGVVGIVASRVLKAFHRPTIILGGDKEMWRGSGRSLPGFDLAAALRECGDLLERAGGHAMAAGVTVNPARIDELRRRLNEAARRAWGGGPPAPELAIDASVDPAELTVQRVEELAKLGPFGVRNPSIQLALRGVRLVRPPRRLGRDLQHASLTLGGAAGASLEALWWNAAEERMPDGVFDAAVTPELDGYNGAARVRLRLLDWRPAEPAE
jgi:single-stranded-DNA-specific exonuclease